MDRSRSRCSTFIGAAVLLATVACSPAHVARPTVSTRPVETRQLTILPAEVTLRSGDTSGVGGRKAALERELGAALALALAGRAPQGGPSPTGEGVVRIQRAFAKSPVYIYREMVGFPTKKPRRRLAETEVRSVAEASGADTLLVAHLIATEVSSSTHVAQSATSFVGATALGVLTLSPTRLVNAAVNVGDSSRGSELRVALVDGPSGEILWANWEIVKRAPSAEVVSDLVRRTFASFPPRQPAYTRVSAR